MARRALRRRQNIAGDTFVDATCIDCDTCRWMAPEVFGREGGMSFVHTQPLTPAARLRSLQALVSCPTASIGTDAQVSWREVQESFPIPIAGDVHHCGYHSESSFGATSYLIRRPEGNILVDSPRFAAPLVRRLEELGGVSTMLLTHRDDVADHARFARHFGLERWIHERDAHGLQGFQCWSGMDAQEVGPGLMMIPVPGHTAGHVVFLLDAPEGPFLFSGDHLAWDTGSGHLEAWPDVCWHDWSEQTRGMERLLAHRFEWVLPGHGRRIRMPWDRMQDELRRLVAWMRATE